MRSWIPLVVRGAFTLLAAPGGVALGQWLQRKQIREPAEERRREAAAAILAPIKALVWTLIHRDWDCSTRNSTYRRR